MCVFLTLTNLTFWLFARDTHLSCFVGGIFTQPLHLPKGSVQTTLAHLGGKLPQNMLCFIAKIFCYSFSIFFSSLIDIFYVKCLLLNKERHIDQHKYYKSDLQIFLNFLIIFTNIYHIVIIV